MIKRLSRVLILILLSITCAHASFDVGFDFRNTKAYVTDPSNCWFTNVGMTYPDSTDFGGATAGWTLNNGTFGDESATNDPRLAGRAYVTNGFSSYEEFRVNLPSAGAYTIVVALGDATGSWQNYLTLLDGSSTTIGTPLSNVGTTANTFSDANGNVIAEASFFASQMVVTHTFTNTFLLVRVGITGGSGFSSLSHLRVTAAVMSSPTRPPVVL